MILARCTPTVFALRPSSAAISLLDLPATMCCKISSSRVVRPLARSPLSASGLANCGSSTKCPCATRLMALARSSSIAFFRMYPRAPASSACRTNVSSECMLSIKMVAAGSFARMVRVASMPLMPGSAQSITITFGLSSSARRTASLPSLASPTTEIAGSSSSMRRKPLRTNAWSSTSRTVSLTPMRFCFLARNGQLQGRASAVALRKFQCRSNQFGAFAHAHESDTLVRSVRGKSFAMIFYLERQRMARKSQAHPRFLGARVPAYIVQRFLQHAVNLHAGIVVYAERRSRFFVVQFKAGLPLHGGNIPVERAFEALFLEQHRMKRLRQAANIVQRSLRDFANFLQVFAQWRTLRHLFFHAAEQRTDRCQHLPEFIMQLARNVPQRGLLRGYQFLRQVAALLRERREPGKNLPVRANQIQACQGDGDQRGGQKNVQLPLHTVVNLCDLRRGLLLRFVVFD